MSANASAVARTLRTNGVMTVPRHTRDGLSVSSARGSVCLITSMIEATLRGSETAERVLLDAAVEVLAARGYRVNRTRHNIAYITKEA